MRPTRRWWETNPGESSRDHDARSGGILLSTLVPRVVGLNAKATVLKSMPEHENSRAMVVYTDANRVGRISLGTEVYLARYIELGQGFRYVQST